MEKVKQIWKLRPTPPRQKMLELFSYLGKIFYEPKTDEQLDTTDMPDLEIGESAAQRKNQQEKGFKILAASQTLSRIPIL